MNVPNVYILGEFEEVYVGGGAGAIKLLCQMINTPHIFIKKVS